MRRKSAPPPMADFAQTGLICTLQRLNETHLAQLELELAEVARTRPIALILPCHGRDLGQPALERMRNELAGATWLGEIVVSLNGLAPGQFSAAQAFFAGWSQPVRLLWNDGPELVSRHAERLGCAPAELPSGKGFNVWAAVGALAAEGSAALVATHDCDVTTFQRGTLARLCYACAHPELNFAFAKMYYPRVSDRLYGRVSRLFLAPLLHALLRVAGHRPLLDFLLSFRYPLAGEMALRLPLAASLPFAPGWALEIALLCEAFRCVDPREICQVDGGSGYDHRHQPAREGLVEMCAQIAGTLFTQLEAEGCTNVRGPAASAFARESQAALRRYAALARINGLPFAQSEEESLATAFGEVLSRAPASARTLPPWQA